MESENLEAQKVLKIVQPNKKSFVVEHHGLETEAKHIFRHHVFVPDGVDFEELLNPAAWVHNAYLLRPMSRIAVTSESSKFIGELVVMSCGQLWAKVEVVFYKEFNTVATVDVNDQYEAKWISNRYKFGVQRKSDGEWMVKELPDQAAANMALASFASEVRRAV
jgi:hypothetical protein